MRVLVLEDDPRLCRAYAQRLRSDGHAVDEVSTLHEARLALLDVDYDCLVLDRLVPDGDALDLVIEQTQEARGVAVLMVSALGDPAQRVEGLAAGADDYVSKPLRLDELALRVRKLVIRATSGSPVPIKLGRVLVDRARKMVLLDGEPVHLTRTQYAVFDHIVAHRDRMVTIDELLEHCWDRNREIFANPLHSQITRLRAAFKGALRFDSVRGAGYVLWVMEEDQLARLPDR